MSSVQFDSNTWYQIVNLGTGDGSGLQVGYPNTEGIPYGSVYGSPFDKADNAHYWQIVQNPVDNSGWLLRCRSTGPGLFAAINNNVVCTDDGNCPDTEVRIQPQLEQTTVMYVDAWDDSSYYIYPSQNGSDYRWDFLDNGSYIWLNTSAAADSSNIQSDAQWNFVDLGAINDPTWSTVSTTASYTATLATAAPDSASTTQSAFTITSHAASTNFPKQGSSSSSGLSTGAQAAIGAAVGGFVLIALIVFGFWFLRRRKRRQTTNKEHNYGYGYSPVEPSGPQIVEAPNPESNAPVELPASRAYNDGYYNTAYQENTGKNPTAYTGYAGYTGYSGTTSPPPPQMPEKHEYQRPYS